jgi:hypothetical protein
MACAATRGTGADRARFAHTKLAPKAEEGANNIIAKSTEEVMERQEARGARFARRSMGLHGMQTESPKEALGGLTDLRLLSEDQDVSEARDMQPGPHSDVQENFVPAFYASWARSREAYQATNIPRSAPLAPVLSPRTSSPSRRKQKPREEWWYGEDLFGDEDRAWDGAETLKKRSLKGPGKRGKKAYDMHDVICNRDFESLEGEQ